MDNDKVIIDTDICPDLSELIGGNGEDIPLIITKGDEVNGTNDIVGYDTKTADNG